MWSSSPSSKKPGMEVRSDNNQAVSQNRSRDSLPTSDFAKHRKSGFHALGCTTHVSLLGRCIPSTHIYMCVCTHIYVCVCIYVGVYIHTHTRTQTSVTRSFWSKRCLLYSHGKGVLPWTEKGASPPYAAWSSDSSCIQTQHRSGTRGSKTSLFGGREPQVCMTLCSQRISEHCPESPVTDPHHGFLVSCSSSFIPTQTTPCRVSGPGDAQQPPQMKPPLHHPVTWINPCAEGMESIAVFFLDTSRDFSTLFWWEKGDLLKNKTPAVIMDYMSISLWRNFKRDPWTPPEKSVDVIIDRSSIWEIFSWQGKTLLPLPLISKREIYMRAVICTFFCQWENTCNTLFLATFIWSSMTFLKSITKLERWQWTNNKTQPILKWIKM